MHGSILGTSPHTRKAFAGGRWAGSPGQTVEVGVKIKMSTKTFNDNVHVASARFLESITTRQLPMSAFLSLSELARTFLGYIFI